MNFDETTPTHSQKLQAITSSNFWFWVAMALATAIVLMFLTV